MQTSDGMPTDLQPSYRREKETNGDLLPLQSFVLHKQRRRTRTIQLLLLILTSTAIYLFFAYNAIEEQWLSRHQQAWPEVTDLIVFGDSWSIGCDWYLTGDVAKRIRDRGGVPQCPHFEPLPQNYYSWVQHLQNEEQSTRKEVRYITSFAEWGATCDAKASHSEPRDGQNQLQLYRTHFNTTSALSRIDSDPKSTVLTIFFGTNDLFSRVLGGYGSADQETKCIEDILTASYKLGFRRFSIVQNGPFSSIKNQYDMKAARKFHQEIKANLQQQNAMARSLTKQWKDAQVSIFPLHSLMEHMYLHHQTYGYKNGSLPCNHCADPYDHFWQDGLHPSSRTMHIIARKYLRYLHSSMKLTGSALFRSSEEVE